MPSRRDYESATITADPGTYWLEIDDRRTTVAITTAGETDGRATTRLPLSVPDDAEGSLSVRIRGGPVGALE